jgi:hypothetical protein
MMVHAYNPSMWETEAGGSWVQGQLGLHSETLSQKKKRKEKEKKSCCFYSIFEQTHPKTLPKQGAQCFLGWQPPTAAFEHESRGRSLLSTQWGKIAFF